ncbi:MAG TPA: hypothetical protein DEP53_15170 [Bacteroidetes bacterium]|nr:hypothetical protein [Bacteroidota bacterium]
MKKLWDLFTRKHAATVPLVIIKKGTDDGDVIEYRSIDEAIADLERDPNVPSEKIDNLRSSLKRLKNNSSIKIRNGELIK